jgi:hypothetical protein
VRYKSHSPCRRPAAGCKICSPAKSLHATSYELLRATDAYRGLEGFDGTREEAGHIVLGTFRPRPRDMRWMVLDTVASSFVTHAPGAELTPIVYPAGWAERRTVPAGVEPQR